MLERFQNFPKTNRVGKKLDWAVTITRASVLKLLVVAFTMMSVAPANAAGAWYRGEIKRIYVFANGFVLTFKTNALDDCKWDYVYFNSTVIPEKSVDRAYSLALSAQAQGKSVGVVIDKDINGPEGVCNGNGSIDLNN